MKKTIIVLTCVLIVLVICYIIKFGKVKVPDDAECIATIIQSNKSNKYYLSYEFYKINGKCVYKKMEEYDVGITTQVVHPKLIDTKYIRNKKSFEKLKHEIEENRSQYDELKIYYGKKDNCTLDGLEEYLLNEE